MVTNSMVSMRKNIFQFELSSLPFLLHSMKWFQLAKLVSYHTPLFRIRRFNRIKTWEWIICKRSWILAQLWTNSCVHTFLSCFIRKCTIFILANQHSQNYLFQIYEDEQRLIFLHRRIYLYIFILQILGICAMSAGKVVLWESWLRLWMVFQLYQRWAKDPRALMFISKLVNRIIHKLTRSFCHSIYPLGIHDLLRLHCIFHLLAKDIN